MATPPTFSVGDVLTANQMNQVGLWRVTPTGATNGTINADGSVTIGNAVGSVVLSGVFSTSFDNYLITIAGGTSSAFDNLLLQLSGATGSTYYTAGNYVQFTVATNNAYAPAAATSYRIGFTSVNGYSSVVTLLNPNLAKVTFANTHASSYYGLAIYGGVETGTAQHTGFTVLPGSGTITGGTITVYGYN